MGTPSGKMSSCFCHQSVLPGAARPNGPPPVFFAAVACRAGPSYTCVGESRPKGIAAEELRGIADQCHTPRAAAQRPGRPGGLGPVHGPLRPQDLRMVPAVEPPGG